MTVGANHRQVRQLGLVPGLEVAQGNEVVDLDEVGLTMGLTEIESANLAEDRLRDSSSRHSRR